MAAAASFTMYHPRWFEVASGAAAAAASGAQPTTAAVPVADANVTADKPAETPKGKVLAASKPAAKGKKPKKETAAA